MTRACSPKFDLASPRAQTVARSAENSNAQSARSTCGTTFTPVYELCNVVTAGRPERYMFRVPHTTLTQSIYMHQRLYTYISALVCASESFGAPIEVYGIRPRPCPADVTLQLFEQFFCHLTVNVTRFRAFMKGGAVTIGVTELSQRPAQVPVPTMCSMLYQLLT